MTRSYLVETAAEADRAVSQLQASAYQATSEPVTTGYVVTVGSGPAVTIEEVLLRAAPSARRV